MAMKPKPRDAVEADVDMGAKLRSLREQHGVTQIELGNKLGISFQQIQKYEKGANRVPSSRLQQISNIFKVPVAYFYEASNFDDDAASVFRDLDAATTRMLRCYSRIKDQETRHQVVLLIETIAKQQTLN